MTMIERFMSFVSPEPNTGCWLWTGHASKNNRGVEYPHFAMGGRSRRANRACWMIFRGTIPRGLVVRHKCDMPMCVNPDHLELGTQKDNVEDRYKRGRSFHHWGETHKRSKLTAVQVAEIRLRVSAGESPTALGRQYGVSDFGIRYVAKQGWKKLGEAA